MQLDFVHAYYEPYATDQEQMDFIAEYTREVFAAEFVCNQPIPVTIKRDLVAPDFDNATVVFLQILDSCNCMINGEVPDSGHPNRQLTRLEVVTWAAEFYQEKLTEPMQMHLDCGGAQSMYLILDRQFQIKPADMKPWTSLALMMTKETFLDLVFETSELERSIDLAICIGYECRFGKNDEEVERNIKQNERGHLLSWRIFGSMAQADVNVYPVDQEEQVEPFLKTLNLPKSPD